MRIEWNKVSVRLAWGGRFHWPRGIRIDATWTRRVFDFDLWLVWDGAGKMAMRSGWLDLSPGACLWLRPGWDYVVEQDPENPLGMFGIHFDLFDVAGKPRSMEVPLPPEVIPNIDFPYVQSVLNRVVAMNSGVPWEGRYHGHGRLRATTLLTGLLMELDDLSDAPVDPGPVDLRMMQLQQIARDIDTDPSAAAPIGELADRVGCSPEHFSRLFKAMMGKSPQAFIIERRVRRACQLLVETGLPIKEVAFALGYRDVYFFSRQFKAVKGRSPAAFRLRSLPD